VEPSLADTIGNKHFVPYSEVSLSQGLLGIFVVGMVLCNRAVELNVASYVF